MHFKSLRFLFTNSCYLVVVFFCCFFFLGKTSNHTRSRVRCARYIYSLEERKKERKRRERDASRGEPHRGDDVAHNKATRFRMCAHDDVVYSIAQNATAQSQNDLPTIPSVQSLRSGKYDAIVERTLSSFKRTRRALRGRFKRIRKTPEGGKFATISRVCEERKTPPEEEPRVQEDVFLHNPKSYSKEHPGVERSTLQSLRIKGCR